MDRSFFNRLPLDRIFWAAGCLVAFAFGALAAAITFFILWLVK